MEKLKISLENNFSINIENNVFQENLEKYINKEQKVFFYKEFLNNQREKIYDNISDESFMVFNDAIVLFFEFSSEIDFNKKKNANFIEKIHKENSFFNFLKYFMKYLS